MFGFTEITLAQSGETGVLCGGTGTVPLESLAPFRLGTEVYVSLLKVTEVSSYFDSHCLSLSSSQEQFRIKTSGSGLG